RGIVSVRSEARAAPLPELKKLTDEVLLERIARFGCCDSMALLFERYVRLSFSISLKALLDPGEAADIMQDVFFEIFQKANQFDGRKGCAKVWIFQYAYHRSTDRRRYLAVRGFYESQAPSNGQTHPRESEESQYGWGTLTAGESLHIVKQG